MNFAVSYEWCSFAWPEENSPWPKKERFILSEPEILGVFICQRRDQGQAESRLSQGQEKSNGSPATYNRPRKSRSSLYRYEGLMFYSSYTNQKRILVTHFFYHLVEYAPYVQMKGIKCLNEITNEPILSGIRISFMTHLSGFVFFSLSLRFWVTPVLRLPSSQWWSAAEPAVFNRVSDNLYRKTAFIPFQQRQITY